MNSQKLSYIEESGIIFEQMGMTRMAGRVFGYLVVSDRSEASFDDIRNTLEASKGSISGTTKQLITIGLIEPITKPGDRKTYFRVSKVNVGTILKSRLEMFTKFSAILKKGNGLKEKDDHVAAWLHEVSSFYEWLGGAIEEVIDRWEVNKKQIMKRREGKDGKNKEKRELFF